MVRSCIADFDNDIGSEKAHNSVLLSFASWKMFQSLVYSVFWAKQKGNCTHATKILHSAEYFNGKSRRDIELHYSTVDSNNNQKNALFVHVSFDVDVVFTEKRDCWRQF
jgi:hypothetical protein